MNRWLKSALIVLCPFIFYMVQQFVFPSQTIFASYPDDMVLQDSIGEPWPMFALDPDPPSGSDGVKLADVNHDGWPDLVCGFEEGGVSRIYINPGPEKAKSYWTYVELPSPAVEDAVLVDLDGNGVMDLVTASEGHDQQIRFHWAPDDPDEYMKSDVWKTENVPAPSGLSAWMFVVPYDMTGRNGMDLIVGSKSKPGVSGSDKAVLGWLECPANPRKIRDWKFHTLSSAGWIMSIDPIDMDDDGLADILISDRKNSSQTGIRWLKNPGLSSSRFYDKWESHLVGIGDGEPMFHTRADLDQDGDEEIVVPDLYQGLTILKAGAEGMRRWSSAVISYPQWAGGRGKAVACGDIDLDDRIDFVMSFEEEGSMAAIPFAEYHKNGKYSVVWAKSMVQEDGEIQWTFHNISGLKGRKFDLITLIDLDGDGDLDVLTNDENEENDGLGVVWYENLVK